MSYTPAHTSTLKSPIPSRLSSRQPFAARVTALPFTPTGNRRLNEFVGLVLLVSSALLLLALVSYRPTDASFDTVSGVAGKHAVQNWAGPIGANASDLLLQLEGAAAVLLPFLLASLGWSWLRSRATTSPWAKVTGLMLYVVFAPAFFGLLPGNLHWMGAVPLEGLTGRLVVDFLVGYLNFPGTCVIVFSILAVSLYLASAFNFTNARSWLAVKLSYWYAWRDRVAASKMAKARSKALKRAEKEEAEYHAAAGSPGFSDEAEAEAQSGRLRSLFSRFSRQKTAPVFEEDDQAMPAARGGFAETEAPYASPNDAYLETPTPPPSLWETMPRAQVADPAPEPEPDFFAAIDARVESRSDSRASQETDTPPEPPANRITFAERADIETRSITTTPRAVSGYRLPPSSLLHRSEDMAEVREEELREEARVLVEKCAEFDVGGQVTQINPGPVVTTFEFRPEAGVKYSRVTGLADDLCLAMAAESILIERMAGKSTVGIQVPNSTRETIWLRDVVESENFVSSKSKLILAMGKDINGRIVTADLATMPHVLIAGSTGSGKSVAINAMIMSILFKNTPEQVRMILVDPKRVELGMYEGIPHLFTPIITEPKLAANALRNAVREMERRLKLLASRSVRNIDQYNRLFDAGTPSLFKDELEDESPLPYIIIIIDELADLMMLDKSNVEEAITRLAQMARAVGIHLVLATQRPSVDVITGLIKANVPTRMSFRLATKVDSRTILDANGAESLLGRGDMLFLPPGTSRVQRVHAPFVTETEISAVVDFWKSQGQAEYVEEFLESPKDDKGRELDANADGSDDSDELFDDAVRLVFEFGKASTSLLQRRLRIGYGRAAHLIDMMERDGLVGQAEGSKPRELLKSAAWLNEVGSESR